MRRIVWDDSHRVVDFVAEKIGEVKLDRSYGIGLERDGLLVAGVVFQDKTEANINMHVASNGSKYWMTPAFLAACFRYAFLQEKCRRVTGLVRADNLEAQKLDENLGFKREGVLREATSDGCDFILYGMLKSECRFLEGRYHAALLDDLRRSRFA